MESTKYSQKIFLVIGFCLIGLIVYFSFLSQSGSDRGEETRFELDQVQPVVALETILTVTDVKQALMEFARTGDNQLIVKWQSQILLVAREAGYPDEELDFLMGHKGIDYLRFRGNRLLFQQAVNKAYRQGDGINNLFRRYPESADLFDQTEQLFIQRDNIIQSIAQTLVTSSHSGSSTHSPNVLSSEEAYEAAVRIWRDRNAAVTPISSSATQY
jgi:hypothetical protein